MNDIPYNSRGVKADLVENIMAFEAGELDDDAVIALFAYLVRTGLAWSLQGSYGRTAQALIGQGYISPGGDIL